MGEAASENVSLLSWIEAMGNTMSDQCGCFHKPMHMQIEDNSDPLGTPPLTSHPVSGPPYSELLGSVEILKPNEDNNSEQWPDAEVLSQLSTQEQPAVDVGARLILPERQQHEAAQDTSPGSSPRKRKLVDRSVTPPTTKAQASETDQFVAIAKVALQKAVAADSSPDWESVKSAGKGGPPGCVVDVTELGKLVMVRVQCTLNASKKEVLAVLEQGRGAPKGTTTELLQQPSDSEAKLMWIEVKLPFIKDREFMVCQWVPPESAAAATSTVVRASLPGAVASQLRPETRKRLRGRIETQVTFVTEVPGNPAQCTLKWMSCVDPGGSLPNLKKMVAKSGASAVAALHKAICAASA